VLERIGNCRIVEEVASGGMAVVYRAVQEPLGRTVAIKALKSSVAMEENITTRFEREAKSLATLQHENIINVYDYHHDRTGYFIIMEFVQGIDLYDLLDRCGRLPYDVAAVIAVQVGRALDYVHYRGVVHRDIKPANIMISKAGGVKLMDFGIARDQSFTDLTEAGTGIGTPAYMSPEQVLGDKLDARSDLFSLGVVLYQMLTGRKPFVEDEQRSAMHKIRLEKHVRVRKLNPDIPRELERIIDHCLEKRPIDRWRSAQHMVMALERFLAKHVEINHHARLVLFLRGQGVISDFEADEHLNPSALGPGTLAQPNMQARHAMRRGWIAHAITVGMLALMLGLIHLAPLGATPRTPTALINGQTVVAEQHGFIRVNATPWAEISIDGQPIGSTPLAKPIELTTGPHVVRFTHAWYEPVEQTVAVPLAGEDKAVRVTVDFERDGKLLPGKSIPTGGTP
jgi:eukaryotic-like serine/threonine-protein kinase